MTELAIRMATAADAPFLREMLVAAADWRPDVVARPVEQVLAEPALAHYVDRWPRLGDVGVVAVDGGRPIGAAWWRFFRADDPGYGFVDSHTPEVSIGVVDEARGVGVGRALLDALIEEARHRSIGALSLSVELDNPAVALYERVGFTRVGVHGGACTMRLELAG